MDIIIDFDGTCVTHEYPRIGKEIGAVPVLKELVAKSHNLILFTMRSDFEQTLVDPTINPRASRARSRHLSDAVDWFKKHEIPLYGIQTNPTQKRWTSSPKAYGQIIIDDSALGCPLLYREFVDGKKGGYLDYPHVDWQEVRKLLVAQGVL